MGIFIYLLLFETEITMRHVSKHEAVRLTL